MIVICNGINIVDDSAVKKMKKKSKSNQEVSMPVAEESRTSKKKKSTSHPEDPKIVSQEVSTSKKQKSTSYPEDPKIVSQKVDTPKKEKKKVILTMLFMLKIYQLKGRFREI